MIIGIQHEPRIHEHRVSLTPLAVKAVVQKGHDVWVETRAGLEAGHRDSDYESAGARIAYGRSEVFTRAELLVGVFAPMPEEYSLLHAGQAVLAFWALPAARREDFLALTAREITAVATEAISDRTGRAPVLTSMSELGGGLAITVGASLLLNELGGQKGILFGGAPGVPSARVVILGAGVLGRSAARAALGAGAQVTLLDVSVDHLREAAFVAGAPVRTLLATQPNIDETVAHADLVLCAAAVRGQRAPQLISRQTLALMEPGTVIMDMAIDMGGCCETSRPTYFPHPLYEVDGILHFCVPNLPSAAARSATQALANAVLPYLVEIADLGIDRAIEAIADLRAGVYLHRGRCVLQSLARAFDVQHEPLILDQGV
jgi:alanine dehydrogenase